MADLALRYAALSRLSALLNSAGDVDGYLQGAVDSAGELLGLEGSSYTLSTILYDAPFTVASTDRAAWEADQVEFDAADGPCFQVLVEGATFDGIDLRTDRRWPGWAAVAELHGFGSAVAVGAELESGQRLVLNGYAVGDAFLDRAAVDRAQEFIDELAVTVPVALRLDEQAARIDQLQQALASQSVIDDALEVLMGENQCTRDEAFGILRRASQDREIRIREVAAAIVRRSSGGGREDGRTGRVRGGREPRS